MMCSKRLLLSTTSLLLMVSAFAGKPSSFHHFAQVGDGELGGIKMRTSFFILSQNQFNSAEVTLRFYDDDGNPMSLNVKGSTGSSYTTTIPTVGMAKVTTPGQGPIKVGWATLTASVPVGAQVFFEM